MDTFWIFVIIFFLVDTWLFTRGYDTFVWKHKTEAELEIQKVKIEKMRQKNE